MSFIINFWNNKQLSAGDTILAAVIGMLIFAIMVFISKSLIKTIINFCKKCKSYLQAKYRTHQGKLSVNELIKIEEKQEAGFPLSKKEEKILTEHQKRLAETMSRFEISKIRMPNIPKF